MNMTRCIATINWKAMIVKSRRMFAASTCRSSRILSDPRPIGNWLVRSIRGPPSPPENPGTPPASPGAGPGLAGGSRTRRGVPRIWRRCNLGEYTESISVALLLVWGPRAVHQTLCQLTAPHACTKPGFRWFPKRIASPLFSSFLNTGAQRLRLYCKIGADTPVVATVVKVPIPDSTSTHSPVVPVGSTAVPTANHKQTSWSSTCSELHPAHTPAVAVKSPVWKIPVPARSATWRPWPSVWSM